MKVNSVILFVIVLVIGCSPDNNINDKPVITVSILPQRYLLQKVAGNRYKINVMIPQGASPATYDPYPGQLQQLSNSDAYFMIGHLEYENVWMKKIASVNKSMPVFDLSSGIELIQSDHHHSNKAGHRISPDPHIWLSPKSVKIICHNIYKALIYLNPSDSLIYKQNYHKFLVELDSLDREINKSLSALDNRTFFIYH